MSEHKFSVGDKVKEPLYHNILEITEVGSNGKYVRAKTEAGPTYTFNPDNLEPISDHMTADELAELIASTPTERQDAEKLDKESEHIAKMMEEVTGYGKGYKIGFKDGYDAHCKEIAQAGIDAMHSEYKRGWRECRAKMMEFISKDYQDDFK